MKDQPKVDRIGKLIVMQFFNNFLRPLPSLQSFLVQVL